MKAVFVCLLTGACATLALAQQNHIPPVLEIFRETIKEGRSAAHEKVEADFARAMRKMKDAPHALALTSMSGAGEAWFLVGHASFASIGKFESEFDKSPMKNELDLLDARDGELRSTSRTMYAVYRPDLSYHADQGNLAKTRFVGISNYRVRLGHDDELAQGAKMLLSTMEKAGITHTTLCYQVVMGVPDGLYLFIEPMESLAQMDEEPANEKKMMEAMGADNWKAFMKGAGNLFSQMQTDVFMVNPKMSFMPKDVEDADPAFWRPKGPAATKPEAKPSGQ